MNPPLINNSTNALAYSIYFAMKYDLDLEISKHDVEQIIEINDCICLILLFKDLEQYYTGADQTELKEQVYKYAIEINTEKFQQDKDKFWLFIYEALMKDEIADGLLKNLKQNDVTFFTLTNVIHQTLQTMTQLMKEQETSNFYKFNKNILKE